MKKFFAHAALAAAALFSVGAANAGVIDFEYYDTSLAQPFAPLIANGGAITQGSYLIGGFDGTGSPDLSLVGSLIGGASGGTCDASIVCPSNNNSTYYTSLNTGAVYLAGPSTVKLQSFDAAFLAPSSGVPTGAFGLLVLEADRSDGSAALGAFALHGPATNGSTSFSTYLASNAIYGLFSGSTGTINSGNVVDVQFFEFYCSSSSLGSCGLDRSNLGQFALDNLTVAGPIPEPSSWLLMALGLAGVGAAARRRRSV